MLKDIDTLTLIADRADDAQLPDVALKALEALESLNFKDKRKLTLKRAQILIKYGNSAEAVRILTPYVEKNQEDKVARLLLINAFVGIRRDDLAIPRYEYLLKEEENNPSLWVDYAQSLENTGQREKAERALLKALSIDPEYSPALPYYQALPLTVFR